MFDLEELIKREIKIALGGEQGWFHREILEREEAPPRPRERTFRSTVAAWRMFVKSCRELIGALKFDVINKQVNP
jgi:hypothetical protein